MDIGSETANPRVDRVAADPDLAVMHRNGILRVPADQYHVDGYRYSSLADALAQVRRSAATRSK